MVLLEAVGRTGTTDNITRGKRSTLKHCTDVITCSVTLLKLIKLKEFLSITVSSYIILILYLRFKMKVVPKGKHLKVAEPNFTPALCCV